MAVATNGFAVEIRSEGMMLTNFRLLILALGLLWLGVHPAALSALLGLDQENSLPPDRFEELRHFAMSHAREISGPRIRNPRLSFGVLEHEVENNLAQQRLYRRSRNLTASPQSEFAGQSQPPTLLPPTRTSTAMLPQNPLSPAISSRARSVCASPEIRSVNGLATGAVFTPIVPDNHFRIEGCAFGSLPGSVVLRPASQLDSDTETIRLNLDGPGAWTDRSIDVHLDPGTTGIADSAVVLIVLLGSGRSVQLPGCMFVAARGEPQLLKVIPAAWVSLDASATSSKPIRQLEYESPPPRSTDIPPEIADASAYVARSDAELFGSGKDSFDLSQLPQGWIIESVQLIAFAPSCPGQNSQPQGSGVWSTSWTARGFAISWVTQSCSSFIAPVFRFSLHSSQYAARVWVVGPAGTQPMRRTSIQIHQ